MHFVEDKLSVSRAELVSGRTRIRLRIYKDRWLYLMLLPGLLYFLIFKYVPMWGLLLAFKDYQPFLGFFGSKWVGLKHFQRLFHDPVFWMLLKNTLILAGYNILFFFPAPIALALLLNEARNEKFKRFVQTVIYVPHFVSWVVVVGIAYTFFTVDGGLVNEAIAAFGGQKINFLVSADWFRTMITSEVIWKETGWGTIIFLAALAGVDPQLYEAARMDGAGRLRQLWHVTLPAIRSTIVILFILRLGTFLDTGFEQIFLMLNAMNREVGEVFDTYVYTAGITQGQFSFSTTVGLFKSLVGFLLIIGSNRLAKKFGEEGVY
ncbi:ABC transporter permease [Paenibacillus roseipurpureus]|uniref:Sugar ABC transporter permease n=1 Tax=Paenibacillus roseopurpureus TaxID=2918901 RepID=A0AA96LK95_9BACL|nr:sugar ABC transporter permease [Paenibacillus sp. MBLB1832]WNR43457.1 sugar ABC transporter permease [Paenibacillus sp. MBLB1832]